MCDALGFPKLSYQVCPITFVKSQKVKNIFVIGLTVQRRDRNLGTPQLSMLKIRIQEDKYFLYLLLLALPSWGSLHLVCKTSTSEIQIQIHICDIRTLVNIITNDKAGLQTLLKMILDPSLGVKMDTEEETQTRSLLRSNRCQR